MFHHRHHSFFPFILALLTLGLIILMFFSFTAVKNKTEFSEQVIVPVSSQEYESELKEIGNGFVASYESAETDMAKLVIVEKTLSELLSLRVPSEFRDIHLELAVLLNQMQTSLKEQNNEKAQKSFDGLSVILSEAKDL